MLIDRLSKTMKIFSIEDMLLNPVAFGKDLQPIDRYGFNI